MTKYMKYPKWRYNPEAPTAPMAVSGPCSRHVYGDDGVCHFCGKTEKEVQEKAPAALIRD